jgi:hypothetical protein
VFVAGSTTERMLMASFVLSAGLGALAYLL